jgi:predicted dehydrogenase
MRSKARIGIIGTGWWATTAHLPALCAHPAAEVAAISDQRGEVLDKAANKYAVQKTYLDYRQMLDNEDLDGAVVAVWHSAHYEVTRDCLERGLHVLVEKPMVLKATHARDLVELAKEHDRELIVGYPWHFSRQALRARQVVQSRELGEVRYINSYFASSAIDFLRGDDKPYGRAFQYSVVGPGDVYGDPKRSGGGQGHLQVTHSAALMLFITGLRPARVAALMDQLDIGLDVVDAITARMDNGALATLGSTGNLQVCDPGKLSLQVNCDKGWLDFDFTTGSGKIRHADGSDEQLQVVVSNDVPPGSELPDELYPLYAPATNLVDVVLGTGANGSPGDVGWRTVELLDAAYRSASMNGRALNVESLYESSTERIKNL